MKICAHNRETKTPEATWKMDPMKMIILREMINKLLEASRRVIIRWWIGERLNFRDEG